MAGNGTPGGSPNPLSLNNARALQDDFGAGTGLNPTGLATALPDITGQFGPPASAPPYMPPTKPQDPVYPTGVDDRHGYIPGNEMPPAASDLVVGTPAPNENYDRGNPEFGKVSPASGQGSGGAPDSTPQPSPSPSSDEGDGGKGFRHWLGNAGKGLLGGLGQGIGALGTGISRGFSAAGGTGEQNPLYIQNQQNFLRDQLNNQLIQQQAMQQAGIGRDYGVAGMQQGGENQRNLVSTMGGVFGPLLQQLMAVNGVIPAQAKANVAQDRGYKQNQFDYVRQQLPFLNNNGANGGSVMGVPTQGSRMNFRTGDGYDQIISGNGANSGQDTGQVNANNGALRQFGLGAQ